MIQFKSIDITSYKSIFHCFLDFEQLQSGLYSLEGVNNTVNFAQSNGSGKSTLINAIMFALYGTTEDSSVKKADYQNKNSRTKLKIRLCLNIQGVDYEIERTDKEFKLFKESEDISELTKTDTEKKFLDILNLSKAEFCSFTYLAQNGSGSFLTKTPSEKLNCIKDFIFGEDLLGLQDKLNNIVKETKAQKDQCDIELSRIDGKLSILERQFSKSELKFEELPYTQDEYKALIQDINEQLKQNVSLKQEKIRQESSMQDIKRQAQRIKSDFEKVKQNVCPTCGQVLSNTDLLDQLKEKANKLKQTAGVINQVLDEISDKLLEDGQVEQLQQTLEEYKKDRKSVV